MQRICDRLHVDPGVLGKGEPDLSTSFDRDELAELRQKRGERGLWRGRRPVLPDCFDELVASYASGPIEDEIAEQQPPLPSSETSLDSPPLDLGAEVSTKVDARRQ